MADGFYIKVDTGRVIERLNLTQHFLSRPDSVYRAIRETMERRIEERFAAKKDPSGQAWAPWAKSTRKQRTREGGVERKPGPISLLEHSGGMKKSFFARTRGGVVQVGFTSPHAWAHEKGTKHMPARRLLTDGNGQLGKNDRISVGMVVRSSVQKTMDKIFK